MPRHRNPDGLFFELTLSRCRSAESDGGIEAIPFFHPIRRRATISLYNRVPIDKSAFKKQRLQTNLPLGYFVNRLPVIFLADTLRRKPGSPEFFCLHEN